MAHKLKRLTICAVALVDRGANIDKTSGEGAHVLLYKRADDEIEVIPPDDPSDPSLTKNSDEGEARTTQQVLDHRDAYEAWWKLQSAFTESLDSIMRHAEADEQPTLLMTAVNEFAGQARQVLPRMQAVAKAEVAAVESELKAIQKVGRKISAARLGRLKAALEALQAIVHETEEQEEDPSMAKTETLPDEAQQQMTALTKRAEAAEQEVVTLKATNDELKTAHEALQADVTAMKADLEKKDGPEDIWKGVHPKLREEFEATQKRAKDAEDVAKAEKDRRVRQEYQAEVKKFDALPMNADDDWETLRDIDTLPEKTAKRVRQLLSSNNEVIRDSALLKEIGRGGSGMATGTAYEKMEAMAKDKVAKGAAKDIPEGIDQVATEHPELVAEYKSERRAR